MGKPESKNPSKKQLFNGNTIHRNALREFITLKLIFSFSDVMFTIAQKLTNNLNSKVALVLTLQLK